MPPPPSRLFSLRHVLLVAFFVGLFALEVGHGLSRLDALRTRARRELLERLEREHADLAHDLRELLGEGGAHATYLSRLPAIAPVLTAGSGGAREELERQILLYLVSFRGIDRVRLLDARGAELVRCERIGAGVGAIHGEALLEAGDESIRRLVEGHPPGEVVVSELVVDAERVEVAESDRAVFHYATRVEEGGASGILAVTVYAAPLRQAVRGFAGLEGVTSLLLDAGGSPFADLGVTADPVPLSPAILADESANGSPWIVDGDLHWMIDEVGRSPRLFLASAVPAAAIEAEAGAWRGEQLRVIASVIVIGLSITIASAFFLRTSLRAIRLRESERYLARLAKEGAKYRALMEGAADMILIVDPATGTVRESNTSAQETLPLPSPSGGAGAALDPLLVETDRPLYRSALRRALDEGPVAERTLRLTGRSGEELEVEARFAAIEFGGEHVIEVSLRDMTHERELERRMRTSDRLSSLGLLTAGVAHEINNPLEGIGNYLSLAQRDGLDDEQRSRYLQQIRQGFERIKNIVGELLRFARPRVDQQSAADLTAVVEGALSVARYSKEAKDVEVRRVGLDRRVPVQGDAGRLEQVLLNLILNAGRAMGGRGGLEIAAERDGDEVVLSVRDEGPGIPEADLGRIFDPFFTRSGGTGLGLAVSYGIVHAHGGTLSARNRPQGGAELQIRLPAAAERPGTVRGGAA